MQILFTPEIIIMAYWLYALCAAIMFWHKQGLYVVFPLISSAVGMYLFLNDPDIFSVAARGLLFTALLSLEVVFLKYSVYPSAEEIIIEDGQHSEIPN